MSKTLIGTVTSDKPDKSIVVTVVTHKTHPVYRKRYISSKKFMAHDEKNEASKGDKVRITETRPLSAKKRFKLDKIIERPALREGIAGNVEVVAAKEKKPIVKKAETPDEPDATETKLPPKKSTDKKSSVKESVKEEEK